jgi:hypothetical protein
LEPSLPSRSRFSQTSIHDAPLSLSGYLRSKKPRPGLQLRVKTIYSLRTTLPPPSSCGHPEIRVFTCYAVQAAEYSRTSMLSWSKNREWVIPGPAGMSKWQSSSKPGSRDPISKSLLTMNTSSSLKDGERWAHFFRKNG